MSTGPRSSFISSNWSTAAEVLAKAYDWVLCQGASPKVQPPHGLVVSIATTLLFFPDALEKGGFPHILKKWFFCSILAKNPLPQTNFKVSDDFRKLKEFLDNGKKLNFPSVSFTPAEIIDVKHTSDTRYGAIQALMRTTAKNDLITGLPLNDDTEDHHIFPYSFVRPKVETPVFRRVAFS